MGALTYNDLQDGSEFWQQRENRNCKLRVIDGPFHSRSMVAGERKMQHRWVATEIDRPVPEDGTELPEAPRIKYLVTDGAEEYAPAIFDTESDLPEIAEQSTKQVHITMDDIKKILADESITIDDIKKILPENSDTDDASLEDQFPELKNDPEDK